MSTLDFKAIIQKFDLVLSRGLSSGLGEAGQQVCIEAAICETLGLPHGDDPGCVAADVRSFKISLNDKRWSSPTARAVGLRDLGIAQLGTKGMTGFSKRMAEKTIRVLIPTLFREVFKDNLDCLAAADECERTGTRESAIAAKKAAYAYADAADAAAYSAAYAYAATAAAYAAANAADAYVDAAAYAAANRINSSPDFYLMLSAQIALQALREMGAPGAEWV